MGDRLHAMLWIFIFAIAIGMYAAAALLMVAYMTGTMKPAHLSQFVEVEALLCIIATMLIWIVKYLAKRRHA